jgi:Caspase domain
MNMEGLGSRYVRQAQRRAMLVGINYYQDTAISHLRYCANDARALHDLLISRLEYGYEQDRLRLLISEDQARTAATRINILGNLTELANAANDGDLLLFYFAGHGHVLGDEAYLLPTDTINGDLFPDTAIPLKRIKDIIQASKARAKVIILDACRSGVALSRALPQEELAFIKSVFEEAEGIAILASSTRDEVAWESFEEGHGVFTYYLLEGLAGAANSRPDQYITLNEIANYVTQKVKEWAKLHHTAQRPNLDFKGTGEIVLLTTANGVMDMDVQTTGNERKKLLREQFPAPVKAKGDFYGRKKELVHIERVLGATVDKSIIVQGERCIGKTSFLKQVMQFFGWRETAAPKLYVFLNRIKKYLIVYRLCQRDVDRIIQLLG